MSIFKRQALFENFVSIYKSMPNYTNFISSEIKKLCRKNKRQSSIKNYHGALTVKVTEIVLTLFPSVRGII